MNDGYQRLLGRRFSRRQVLAGAAGATASVAGLGLLGCSGDDEAPSASGSPEASGEPKLGGILKLRQQSALPNMNPFGSGISNLGQALYLGFSVYDHLWYVPTDTGETEYFLATEIEQIDELTVRVAMGDAVFHNRPPVNGRAVLSSDVKASVERFRGVTPIAFSWLHDVFERMDTPDDLTVVYNQNRPWAWFFTSSNAGSPISSSILPVETVGDDDFLNGDAIGSGRWLLDGHDDGANIRLRKFPSWREPGLPRLDGVDNVFIPENAAAQASFAAGDVDTITALTRLEVEDLEGRLGDRIQRTSDLSRAYRTLMLKFEEPFIDKRVRQGINLALNRQEIMQGIDLGDGELSGPVPPAHERYVLGASELEEYFRHDPDEARSMLEAADFPFDQEFELKFASLESSTQLAQLIEQQLNVVGIRLKLTTQDLLTVWLPQTLNQGQFQMTCFTHLAYEDPDLPLRFYMSSTAEINNFMDYSNPDVDDAILAAAEELVEERRVELTKEAQRVLIDDYAPMLNLYSPISYGARYTYVKEAIIGRGSYGLFNSKIWLDK